MAGPGVMIDGATGLVPPEHDPDEVRGRVTEILARDEFQPPDRTLLRQWWDGFVDWLRSLFESDDEVPDLSELSTDGGGGGPGALVAYFLLAAVLVLAIWAIWRLVRSRTPKAVTESDDGVDVTVMIDEHRTASDWRTRAADLEADARWKEAVRAWLRWGIADLIDRGVLEDVPGRTTGEYRRYLARAHPDLGPDFDQATRLFDEIWYADHPATAESVTDVRGRMEAVVDAAPRRGRAGEAYPYGPMAEIT